MPAVRDIRRRPAKLRSWSSDTFYDFVALSFMVIPFVCLLDQMSFLTGKHRFRLSDTVSYWKMYQ